MEILEIFKPVCTTVIIYYGIVMFSKDHTYTGADKIIIGRGFGNRKIFIIVIFGK